VLDKAEHLLIDRKDREAFESMVQHLRFDAVVDNIAYEAEDVRSAVRAFKGRIGHYLCTSSIAVYATRDLNRPLLERDADLRSVPSADDSDAAAFHPSRGQTYVLGKRQGELVLEQEGREFPYTAMRAPIVVGPDDRTHRVWWFVQRLLDGGPIIVPDWGHSRIFQVVTADDLAEAFVSAIGNPAALCQAYNIAQPDILTAESWTEGLASALGVTPQTVRIPESLLPEVGLQAYAMPIAGRPFGHALLDTSAARADLGFEPAPFDQWIGQTAVGCAESPPSEDSQGYAGRAVEIEIARRYAGLVEQSIRRFVASG
jgi:nucleoside-diphosphate-sugar epimerase